jgi:RHS repeat-associated protein
MYPNSGTGLSIEARVDTFAYDVMGNMTLAWNDFSHVTRTYNKDGTLATETQMLRHYADTTFDNRHYYNLTYTYDLNGRRTALIHPDSLAPSGTDTVQLYDYTSFGALASVTNVFGEEHTFSYDAEGRLTGIDSPGSSDWTFEYDNDSRLASRLGPYHNETLTYDQRGLITGINASGSVDYDMTNYYSGLGHVIASYQDRTIGDDVIEQFGNDAMGRVKWQRAGGSSSTHPTQEYEYAGNGSGRLNRIVGIAADYPPYGWIPDTTYNEYDGAGNVELSGRRQYYWTGADPAGADRRASQSYYSADGKLMVQQTYQDSLNNNLVVMKRRGMYEEYWYDALGRRVLVRGRADSLCFGTDCYSSIERFAWDGDQILYEIRHPGDDDLSTASLNYSPRAAVSPGEQYGIVGYTHGGQTDRPLDVYRMNYEQNPVRFMPTTDYRGTMDAGRTMSSTQFGCSPVWSEGCEEVDWPGEYQMTYRNESQYHRPYDWFGSLVQDKKDGTGLMYMRNRYYDPQTGQFTQEDPIGLAGGLNLYGFAGGDPINFSDPFGLCPQYICQLMTTLLSPVGVQTRYAHLNSTSVTAGMQVSQGQALGESGNTGRSTGPHLHYETRTITAGSGSALQNSQSQPVDPSSISGLSSPVGDAPVSSGFGLRPDPVHGELSGHNGTDFAVPTGTSVNSTAAGEVALSGTLPGYGNVVYVNHKVPLLFTLKRPEGESNNK